MAAEQTASLEAMRLVNRGQALVFRSVINRVNRGQAVLGCVSLLAVGLAFC